MAHRTLQAGAPNIRLTPGMILRLEALNPTADATVAGVTATQWLIYGTEAPRALLELEDVIGPWIPDEVVGAGV